MSDEKWKIVPAAAGQTAVVVYVLEDEGRPGEADVFSDQYPVCAWRVHHDPAWAEPVLPVEVTPSQSIYLVMLDGRLSDGAMGGGWGLERAKQMGLMAAQIRWDNVQACRVSSAS